MRFDWDKNKASANLRKHGIAFDEAVTVFYDPLAATFEDVAHSSYERREITVGYSARGQLLVVASVDRGESMRVISARKATANERKRYEA